MERDKALGILKALADGVDLRTGEAFPAGSPCRQPDSVRALCFAELAAEHQRSRRAIEARLTRLKRMPPPSGPAAREAMRASPAAQ